ncbi:hypothetical protein [Terrisporobacter petrolearius]|uniref:hypothetical protein n=1 Tax=Terrisporobacter petrolearius TaxID=1460447 RepID=UPI0031CCBC76
MGLILIVLKIVSPGTIPSMFVSCVLITVASILLSTVKVFPTYLSTALSPS